MKKKLLDGCEEFAILERIKSHYRQYTDADLARNVFRIKPSTLAGWRKRRIDYKRILNCCQDMDTDFLLYGIRKRSIQEQIQKHNESIVAIEKKLENLEWNILSGSLNKLNQIDRSILSLCDSTPSTHKAKLIMNATVAKTTLIEEIRKEIQKLKKLETKGFGEP